MAEDLQDLLACTAQVLIVPWFPETATERLLDTVKGVLREPVCEQTVLRPTLMVKGLPPLGRGATLSIPRTSLIALCGSIPAGIACTPCLSPLHNV